MEKFNSEKIVKVRITDSTQSDDYVLKKEIKFLGITLRKGGFYEKHFGDYCGDEVPNSYDFINGVLYENPKVTIWYESDYRKTYVFDTYAQALAFFKKHTKSKKFIR